MSVEVRLELGHKAAMKDKPTTEGFTHDWTVFVKGCDGSNIFYFVEKVVFCLHESFPKPRRVVKEPPYQVSECGYAGFMMPIEIYFRNKEEPKKVRFEYDLFLRLEGSPVHNIRVEKLTFQNPSEEFRRKLLKARSEKATSAAGGGVSLPTLAVAPLVQHSEEQQQQQRTSSHTKSAPIAEKRPKSHSTTKETAKPAAASVAPPPPPPPPSAAKSSQPFENIFGVPIKAKNSPDASAKTKDTSHASSQKSTKGQAPQSVSAANKDIKPVLKDAQLAEGKEQKGKNACKTEKEIKPSTKRPLTPDKQNSSSASSSSSTPTLDKKRKHGSNEKLSSSSSKSKDTKDKKDKQKDKSKSSSSTSSTNRKDKPKSSYHKDSSNHKLPSPKTVNATATESKNAKAISKADDNTTSSFPSSKIPHTPPEIPHTPPEPSPSSPVPEDDDFASHSSSDEYHSSPESVKQEEEEEASSYDSVNNHSFVKKASNSKRDSIKPNGTSKMKTPPSKSPTKYLQSKQNGTMKEKRVSPLPERSPKQAKVTYDMSYHQELVELQQKIMTLSDHSQLQRIVDVIEKTGKFSLSSSSFDFDLCSLDVNTVRQLKNCLPT